MKVISMELIDEYIDEQIRIYLQKRTDLVSKMTLEDLLERNPYRFRLNQIYQIDELINGTMFAFLSSSEEKMFGDFLEDLAIFVAGKTTGGHKSTSQGVDLEFANDGTYYVVSVKSGSNWGNSSQHKKLAQDLRDAVTRLRQSKHAGNIQPTLGICYGKTKTTFTSDGYLKVVGQNFWTLISGNKDLYTQIIEPIGYHAEEHNEAYKIECACAANRLIKEFLNAYCDENGTINWPLVVEHNSGNYDLDTVL